MVTTLGGGGVAIVIEKLGKPAAVCCDVVTKSIGNTALKFPTSI